MIKLLLQSPPLLHEAASDAVCALLQVVADQENEELSQDSHFISSLNELRSLEDTLVEKIKGLETPYHLSVSEEDTEK